MVVDIVAEELELQDLVLQAREERAEGLVVQMLVPLLSKEVFQETMPEVLKLKVLSVFRTEFKEGGGKKLTLARTARCLLPCLEATPVLLICTIIF